jgi:hypothetical protein
MTVKKLIEILSQFPGNMSVFIDERKTEFTYGLLNSVRKQTINMKEDPYDDEVLAREEVVVLDEE